MQWWPRRHFSGGWGGFEAPFGINTFGFGDCDGVNTFGFGGCDF